MAAAVALAILEVVAPGYIFLGFAIGAFFMGAMIGLGIAGFSLPWALVVFAVLSLVAFLAQRRFFGIHNGQVKIWDRDIND
jgi:membrane protein implicated in regulation of membrane protease activity